MCRHPWGLYLCMYCVLKLHSKYISAPLALSFIILSFGSVSCHCRFEAWKKNLKHFLHQLNFYKNSKSMYVNRDLIGIL